jgi:hypothetical protein
MRARRLLVAIALTVLPTATVLAVNEVYDPSGCNANTSLNQLEGKANWSANSWLLCPMTNATGCRSGDYSLRTDIFNTGFNTCSLTIGPSSSTPLLEFPLTQQSASRHARCDGNYCAMAGYGPRSLRCRTNTGANATKYNVLIGANDLHCP